MEWPCYCWAVSNVLTFHEASFVGSRLSRQGEGCLITAGLGQKSRLPMQSPMILWWGGGGTPGRNESLTSLLRLPYTTWGWERRLGCLVLVQQGLVLGLPLGLLQVWRGCLYGVWNKVELFQCFLSFWATLSWSFAQRREAFIEAFLICTSWCLWIADFFSCCMFWIYEAKLKSKDLTACCSLGLKVPDLSVFSSSFRLLLPLFYL